MAENTNSVEEQINNALRRAVRIALNNATSSQAAKAFVQQKVNTIFEEI